MEPILKLPTSPHCILEVSHLKRIFKLMAFYCPTRFINSNDLVNNLPTRLQSYTGDLAMRQWVDGIGAVITDVVE